MREVRWLPVVGLLLAGVMAIAACGGGGNGDEGDENRTHPEQQTHRRLRLS